MKQLETIIGQTDKGRNITAKEAFDATVKGGRLSVMLGAWVKKTILSSGIKSEDKKGRDALRAKFRAMCGLPETSYPSHMEDGKQVKDDRENRFGSMLSNAWRNAFPKAPKAPKAPKGEGESKSESVGPVTKGLTKRTEAYALILQDLANAKSHAAMSTSQIKAGEKLIATLKSLSELGYPD